MLPYLGAAAFGNPSSSHRFGRTARAGLEQARREVAEAVGAEPEQVVFTSGGTEADNLAVIGACLAARHRGQPMIAAVCATEHKAVLAAAHAVKDLGGEERILPVDTRGRVELDALSQTPARASGGGFRDVGEQRGRDGTAGCRRSRHDVPKPAHSCTLMPSRAFGKIPIRFARTPCTMLTISGHKIGAPKGVGALIVRERKALEAIIHGGGQQFGIRPAPRMWPGAVGLGRAAALAVAGTRLDRRSYANAA